MSDTNTSAFHAGFGAALGTGTGCACFLLLLCMAPFACVLVAAVVSPSSQDSDAAYDGRECRHPEGGWLTDEHGYRWVCIPCTQDIYGPL